MTDIVPPNEPPEVSDLVRSMSHQGLTVVEDQLGGMASRLLIMSGPVVTSTGAANMHVEIEADRAHWSVALRSENMAESYDARVWKAVLDHEPLRAWDLAVGCGFVAYRLSEAAQAAQLDPDFETALQTTEREFMRRRNGLFGE